MTENKLSSKMDDNNVMEHPSLKQRLSFKAIIEQVISFKRYFKLMSYEDLRNQVKSGFAYKDVMLSVMRKELKTLIVIEESRLYFFNMSKIFDDFINDIKECELLYENYPDSYDIISELLICQKQYFIDDRINDLIFKFLSNNLEKKEVLEFTIQVFLCFLEFNKSIDILNLVLFGIYVSFPEETLDERLEFDCLVYNQTIFIEFQDGLFVPLCIKNFFESSKNSFKNTILTILNNKDCLTNPDKFLRTMKKSEVDHFIQYGKSKEQCLICFTYPKHVVYVASCDCNKKNTVCWSCFSDFKNKYFCCNCRKKFNELSGKEFFLTVN